MKIKIKQPDLHGALAAVHAAVERKTTIPILSNVLIVAELGAVRFTATDLELAIHVSRPAEVLKPGRITMPAKRLMDYVRLLPDADVEISISETMWATLTCGRAETRIACMDAALFPETPDPTETLAKIPAAALVSAIKRTSMAVSEQESRFSLNGAFMLLQAGVFILVSTDGHRMAYTSSLNVEGQFRGLFPRRGMIELAQLCAAAPDESAVEFSSDENHLYFRLGESRLLCRKKTGNFPDYERVLPREHPNEIWVRRDELRRSLERVGQFSDERSRAVRLRMQPGELKVYSSLAETGESEETLPIEYRGPIVESAFNASYILEFLKVASAADVKFLFKDSQSAGELRDGSGDDYRYVVMPMRI